MEQINPNPADQLSDEWFRDQARERMSDGEIDVDENAVVSRGNDPGAYVQAWVWVPAPSDQ